jgi:hypothetical protein
MFQIFGEARQGGKAVAIAAPVAACIEKQQDIAGRMQRSGQRQHHFGIASPAMNNSQRGRTFPGRHEPAEHCLPTHGGSLRGVPEQAVGHTRLAHAWRSQTGANYSVYDRHRQNGE